MEKTNEAAMPIRNYKDSVFRMLFSEKKALLSLYNALNGTDYTDPDGRRTAGSGIKDAGDQY